MSRRAAIIIFGAAVRADGRPSGAMRHRIEGALLTQAAAGSAVFMPTGGQGQFGPAEADVMAEALERAGVSPADIVAERTGRNTIGSVRACAGLLRGHEGAVFVATSRYHMARCVVLLRMAGVPARPGRVPRTGQGGRQWFWWGREMAALPIDIALMFIGRLRRRSPH